MCWECLGLIDLDVVLGVGDDDVPLALVAHHLLVFLKCFFFGSGLDVHADVDGFGDVERLVLGFLFAHVCVGKWM